MNAAVLNWFLLLLLSTIWGSSFILMKLGMETTHGEAIFTHTQVAALRMSIAALFLLPFALRAISKLRSQNIWKLVIVGIFGNFAPAFLFTFAETGISTGYAGMLNSCTPIFALLIGFAVFQNRLNRLQILGVIIGTLGIVGLTTSGQAFSISGSWIHVGAVVLATLGYAISLNTIKYTLQHLKSVEITALSFFLLLIPGIPAVFLSGSISTIAENPHALSGLGYIALLSIIGTAFAVILFNRLISNTSILFASSVTYLIPVVAILIGLALNETINVFQVGSMLIILSGVFVANVLGKKKLKPEK
jgi:drug/metabolite transporter (DMT)-like permease